MISGAPETARTPFQDVSNSPQRPLSTQCQQRATSEPDLTRVDCNMMYVIAFLFRSYIGHDPYYICISIKKHYSGHLKLFHVVKAF